MKTVSRAVFVAFAILISPSLSYAGGQNTGDGQVASTGSRYATGRAPGGSVPIARHNNTVNEIENGISSGQGSGPFGGNPNGP